MLSLSLKELAIRAGIHPRTIRFYVEEGLLPGPEGSGRAASYGEQHLNRLRIIQILQDRRGWPLKEIRRRLLGMTDSEITALAAQLGVEDETWVKDLDLLPASPLAFVRALQAARAEERHESQKAVFSGVAHVPPEAMAGAVPMPTVAALRTFDPSIGLAERSESWVTRPASHRPVRRSDAKLLYEIEITPDVSLVVKGLSGDEADLERKLRRFESFAEHIRQLLTKLGHDDG